MNRMKLRFLDCRYSIQEENGVVVAEAAFICGGYKFTTKGIARCHPSIFDKKSGMQLARARAERQAYLVVRRHIKELIANTNRALNILNNSLDFFNECIQHQDEYIDTF